MKAEDVCRPLGNGSEFRDRNRGGVAGDQGFGTADPVQLLENRLLDREVFKSRFDGQAHIRLFRQAIDGGDPLENGFSAFFQLAFFNELADGPIDVFEGPRQRRLGDIMQEDLQARLGAYLGDSAAHQTRSDYQHTFDLHFIPLSLVGRSF